MVPGKDLYAVYERPSDYPAACIVQRWTVYERMLVAAEPCIVGASVTEVTEELRRRRPELVSVGRHPNDDPHLREVWL